MEADGYSESACRIEARKETAAFTRSSEMSVWRWVKRWNNGTGLGDKAWGGYREYTLRRLGLEDKARQWVRLNALIKGQKNMTCESFARYCNEELLWSPAKDTQERKRLIPAKKIIGLKTAHSWLLQLGFKLPACCCDSQNRESCQAETAATGPVGH